MYLDLTVKDSVDFHNYLIFKLSILKFDTEINLKITFSSPVELG